MHGNIPFMFVSLLGQSGCSSPSATELHGSTRDQETGRSWDWIAMCGKTKSNGKFLTVMPPTLVTKCRLFWPAWVPRCRWATPTCPWVCWRCSCSRSASRDSPRCTWIWRRRSGTTPEDRWTTNHFKILFISAHWGQGLWLNGESGLLLAPEVSSLKLAIILTTTCLIVVEIWKEKVKETRNRSSLWLSRRAFLMNTHTFTYTVMSHTIVTMPQAHLNYASLCH